VEVGTVKSYVKKRKDTAFQQTQVLGVQKKISKIFSLESWSLVGKMLPHGDDVALQCRTARSLRDGWVFVSEAEMANVRREMFFILLAVGLDLVEAISCRVFGSLR
jgi:hypothetical protein